MDRAALAYMDKPEMPKGPELAEIAYCSAVAELWQTVKCRVFQRTWLELEETERRAWRSALIS